MNDDILKMAREAGGWQANYHALYDHLVMSPSALARLVALARAAEQDRCCRIIYGMAGSDNVAQRTVEKIRSKEC